VEVITLENVLRRTVCTVCKVHWSSSCKITLQQSGLCSKFTGLKSETQIYWNLLFWDWK